MFGLIIFLTCLLVAVAFGLASAWSDLRGMTIPNRYSLYILSAFGVAYTSLWLLGHAHIFGSLGGHALSALIVFLITLAMFALGGIGAADSKLATVCALWVGFGGLTSFLIYMTIFGGVLGVCALVLKKHRPFKNPKPGSWPDQVQKGASKVPYGLAIIFGMLASFLQLGYLNIDTLRFFLAG